MSTYGFTVGAVVQAEVRAHNANGWGDYSNVNTVGGTIQTIPTSAPTLSVGAATSATQAQVTWAALTGVQATGNNAITSYGLEWDQGTSTWTELVGETTPFTGTTYT